MTKDIESIDESLFESIKHINEYGMEYWTARELLKVLQYGEYRFFSKKYGQFLHFPSAYRSHSPFYLCFLICYTLDNFPQK